MASADHLVMKYDHYRAIGHGVYAVTLSTYVKSERRTFNRSSDSADDRWRMFWDHHFIFGVKRSLPFKAKIDHDWVLECSPEGYLHYHGLLAVDASHKHKLWTQSGLNKRLRRRLDSFSDRGKYRPFRINKYLVEPVENVKAWSCYSTKQNGAYLNTNVLPTRN